MTFEEFFQKKRINLTALQAGEPALFSEFKTHFEQMGEKSFDHTKKYWFNKLRLLYHLSADQKPEKMHLENRLAEQTIVETLTDTIPKPSVGFKPRFNAAAAKPVEEAESTQLKAKNIKPEAETESPVEAAPKPAGFKPRFNPKMVAPKAVDEAESTELTVEAESPKPEAENDIPAPKPAGFKPRFNAKTMAAKPTEDVKGEEPKAIEEAESTPPKAESETPAEIAAPKPAGFKPRFNAKMMAAKPAEEVKSEEPKAIEEAESTPLKAESEAPVEIAAPKPAGFKPRFNMKMVAPKTGEGDTPDEIAALPVAEKPAEVTEPTGEAPPAENPAADIPTAKPAGFKPRFNAKTMKPKPPQE